MAARQILWTAYIWADNRQKRGSDPPPPDLAVYSTTGVRFDYQLKPVPAETLVSLPETAPVSETLTFGSSRRW